MRPVRWLMILGVVLCWWSAAVSLPAGDGASTQRDQLREPRRPLPAWIDGSGSPVAIHEPRERRGGTGPERREGIAPGATAAARVPAWRGDDDEDRAGARAVGGAARGRWTRGPPRGAV